MGLVDNVMPSCEMCGEGQQSLTTVTVSGAKLDVCEACTEYGTPIKNGGTENGTSESAHSESDSLSNTVSERGSSAVPNGRQPESEIRGLVSDYSTVIHEAREASKLSIEELADRLDADPEQIEEAENGEEAPGTTLQVKLEQFLNITLSDTADGEWPPSNTSSFDNVADWQSE